ncbi:hypothetical protein HUSEC_07312, partial [Escherichia coli O104:H4 str. LB226692]
MVTVASLNHPAPPEKEIVTEFKVPISFGVNVISAVSAFPLTFRLDGTLPFALSFAALTAFGVAASVSDVLLVALLSCTIPFSSCSHPQAPRRMQYPLPVLPLSRRALPRIPPYFCSVLPPSHCQLPLSPSWMLSWRCPSLLTPVWSPHLLKLTPMMPIDAAELADDAAAVFEDSALVSDAFAFVSDVFA